MNDNDVETLPKPIVTGHLIDLHTIVVYIRINITRSYSYMINNKKTIFN